MPLFAVLWALWMVHSSGHRCQHTIGRKITLSVISTPILHFILCSRLWRTCLANDKCVAFTTAVTMQYIGVRSQSRHFICRPCLTLDSGLSSFSPRQKLVLIFCYVKVWWLFSSTTTSRFVKPQSKYRGHLARSYEIETDETHTSFLYDQYTLSWMLKSPPNMYTTVLFHQSKQTTLSTI